MIRKKSVTALKSEGPAVTPEQTIEEARRCIAVAGGRREWSDTRDCWLARAAAKLGITHGRAVTLFYRKAKAIPAHEFLTLQMRAREIEQREAARREYIAETRTLAQESGSPAAVLAGDLAGAALALAEWAEGLKHD